MGRRANIGGGRGGGVIAMKGTHDLGITTWEPIVYSRHNRHREGYHIHIQDHIGGSMARGGSIVIGRPCPRIHFYGHGGCSMVISRP